VHHVGSFVWTVILIATKFVIVCFNKTENKQDNKQ